MPSLADRLGQAGALLGAGDFTAAATVLAAATEAHPESAEAWKHLGVAQNKIGDATAAERSLRTSIALDGADDDAWSSLGGVYLAAERYDEALACFEQVLADGIASTFALVNYLTLTGVAANGEAAVAGQSALLASGEAACDEQIARGENLPWALFDLGQIRFFTRRVGQARVAVRAAIAESTDWQVAAARWPYELLARGGPFAADARIMLEDFAGHEAGGTP